MYPTDGAFDFSTQPPAMLTTIEAAENIVGEYPISAIRIQVDGVEEMGDRSQEILVSLAAQIEEETGLITDITLGSSPQPALTYVPAIEDLPALGWLEQPWVRLGSSYTIFEETKLGFSGIIGSVMAVAVVYVFSSNVISLFARRKEFAVLASIGWRPNQLSRLLLAEATIVGLFVAIIAWLILGLALIVHETAFSLDRFLFVGLFGLLIYWLGSILPAWMIRNIRPYETMRSGEMTQKVPRFWMAGSLEAMAFNNVCSKYIRSVLSMFSMAFPTTLLAFFIIVTFQMQGAMYLSWLGEYVALEVGMTHFIAMGVAFLLATLTISETMWQNVSERVTELASLKAIGWRNSSLRRLILLEGAILGLLSGAAGSALAFMLIFALYGEVQSSYALYIIAAGIVPVAASLLGAVPPAERTVRIVPAEGIRGEYSNKKSTEKRLSMAILATALCLLITLSWTVLQLTPDAAEQTRQIQEQNQPSVEGTSGELTDRPSVSAISEEENENNEGATEPVDSDSESADSNDQSSHPVIGDLNEQDEILKLGEVFTLEGGGSAWHLHADLVGESENESESASPVDGMKYVTIQVTYEREGYNSAANYVPWFHTLVTAEEELDAVQFKTIERSELGSGRIGQDEKVVTEHTFEVPEDEENAVLSIRIPSYFEGAMFYIELY